MPQRNFRNLRQEYLASVNSTEALLQESNLKLKQLESEIGQINRLLQSAPEKIGYTESDVQEMNRKLTQVSNAIEQEKRSQVSCTEKINETLKKLSAIERIKAVFPIEAMNAKITEHSRLEKQELDTKHQVDREKLILGGQEKSVAKLSEVPCGESFPTCKFIKDSIKDKRLIDDQRRKLESLKESLKEITSTLRANDIEDAIDKVKKYNDAINREKSLTSERQALDAGMKLSASNIERLQRQEIELRQQLENAKQNMTNTPEAQAISGNRRRLTEAEKELRSLRSAITEATSQRAVYQEKIRNLQEEEERFNEVTAKRDFYDKLLSAYGKDGIPMLIVRDELPRINEEISKILQGVTGFTVTLETDDSGSDLDIYLDYGDSRRPIELGSGMEKMLSSLAIRVALINISSLPKSDILIIDEGFGALDEQNVESCNKLLHSLKRFFKTVLVISHVDAVKDAVDGFIEVTTRGPDAHVSATDSLPNS